MKNKITFVGLDGGDKEEKKKIKRAVEKAVLLNE